MVLLTGGAEALEVVCDEEGRTVLKPMPLMTGRDGQGYTPLQAMGHVLGLRKKSVDTTVSAVKTAACLVAEKAQAVQSTFAAALQGKLDQAQCIAVLRCAVLCCAVLCCAVLCCAVLLLLLLPIITSCLADPALISPALPCPALPCPALPCPALPYFALPQLAHSYSCSHR